MISNIQNEILEYLQYENFSIALRRLLDICRFNKNYQGLSDAIVLSKGYAEKAYRNELNADDKKNLLDNIKQILALSDWDDISIKNELLLKAEGISKRYSKGSFQLHAMDVALHRGAIIGLVGENGNGKTTLLNLLSKQLASSSGQIFYPVFPNVDEYTLRSKIAFVPQRIPKWYGLLKDNLHFSASISGLYKKENELMVDFMLERLGLSKFEHLTWNQISSGYRTRFELARVLLQKPDVLILDEPLANLDINTQEIILNDLRFMAKNPKAPFSIILSSQQLHEVEKVADEIIVLRDGKHIHTQRKTQDADTESNLSVVEIESKLKQEEVFAKLKAMHYSVRFNGGFYKISSEKEKPEEILQHLIQSQIGIAYYRDITNSSKRFF